MRDTIKLVRQWQPDVMIRNRGIGNYGDYHTPERVVPEDKTGTAMPWMVIYPLGRHFSYESQASEHKGSKWVVDNLVDSVSKGGNFMVGIGPDGNGRFHPEAIRQLEEVGGWLRHNGDAIWDTKERPGAGWHQGEHIRFTQSTDERFVYAVFLQRPVGTVRLDVAAPAAGAGVTLLETGQSLAWRADGDGVLIDFPSDLPESLGHVVRLPRG
jgi:alpha-L-fucosidase